MVELILSGDSANKDVRKRYSESATLDRIGANLAEVLRHADALSVAALVAPLAAVARAGGADNAARLSKKMLGVFFEEKRTDSKVGRGGCGARLPGCENLAFLKILGRQFCQPFTQSDK